MNAVTQARLGEIFDLLAKARTKAREQVAGCDDCDLDGEHNRRKYLFIAAMIGDVQSYVASAMRPGKLRKVIAQR